MGSTLAGAADGPARYPVREISTFDKKSRSLLYRRLLNFS